MDTIATDERQWGSLQRSDDLPGRVPAPDGRGADRGTIVHITLPSPLGRMLLAATGRGLCSVQFGDSDAELQASLAAKYPRAALLPAPRPHDGHLALSIETLDCYLAGTGTSLAVPVDVPATAFERSVWNFLQGIPYGETRSYTEVAAQLGQPGAVRAVASACARNCIALLIPCHRVLRSDGSLGGFRWGLARKRALLALEAGAGGTVHRGLFD